MSRPSITRATYESPRSSVAEFAKNFGGPGRKSWRLPLREKVSCSKPRWFAHCAILLASSLLAGCGTIKGQTATEQLLVSNAVDRTLSQIDFRQLSGESVYLDTQFLKPVRSVGFVNSDYIVGSLRELMFRDRCLLQDKREDADYVVEIRVGALGTDNHEVNYGVPGNTVLNQTAGLLTSSPLMPAIPELSFARKSEQRAAAKIAVFAYRRETHEPVWQTGIIHGLSSAKSTWILGAGPFQKGEIYEDSQLASGPVNLQNFDEQDFAPLRPFAVLFDRDRDVVAKYTGTDRFSPEAIEHERLRALAENARNGEEPTIAASEDSPPTEFEAEPADASPSEEDKTTVTVSLEESVEITSPGDEPPGNVVHADYDQK